MSYSKTRLSWEFYKAAESSFFDFLEYVPLKKDNETVVSPKLLMLIFQIGNFVDTTFKHMAQYSKLSQDPHIQKILNKLKGSTKDFVTIGDCRVAFEGIYKLSEREVIVKSQPFFLPELTHLAPLKSYTTMVPFSEFGRKKRPTWWIIYKGLKHYSLEKIEDATMRNALEALSGLFLLNIIDEQNWSLLAWEVVDGSLHSPSQIFTPRSAHTKLFYFEWKEKIEFNWPKEI